MNDSFPDADTMRTALALATRAPSVHNTQPWLWRVGAQSVHLYADMTRQMSRTDADGRDLMVSCGAALNHCVVALAGLGWQSKIHRVPNPADPTHVAAIELTSGAASEADVTLAAAIPKRRTDRRHFSPWPVPHGDIALMGARAARVGVRVRHVEIDNELRAVLAQVVWAHASDAGHLSELATWSGRYAATAGVPARSVPPCDPLSPVPGRWFAGTALAQPDGVGAAVDDHSVLLALGTVADNPVDRLRAGEATSLMWLTATAVGLATCPVTEPLEIERTRTAIQADAFEDAAYLQMLLRVGWPPINADPLPATPRRPLDDVVCSLDALHD